MNPTQLCLLPLAVAPKPPHTRPPAANKKKLNKDPVEESLCLCPGGWSIEGRFWRALFMRLSIHNSVEKHPRIGKKKSRKT